MNEKYNETIDVRLESPRNLILGELKRLTFISLQKIGALNYWQEFQENSWLNPLQYITLLQCLEISAHSALSRLSITPDLTLQDRLRNDAVYRFVMYGIEVPEVSLGRAAGLNTTIKFKYSENRSIRWIQIAQEPTMYRNEKEIYLSRMRLWEDVRLDKKLVTRI